VNVFIRQLTGVRFVAAAWVVLYHYQIPLAAVGILTIPGVADVLRVGRLGVDLFFALSGFIITHTYLRRLGPALRARASLDFWWLRLARVYPVHLVMIVIAGTAVVAQAILTGDALTKDWINPLDLAKNLLLVQEWGPAPSRGWNFVAWSLSMEWLAYLLFPLLVLVLWRLHRRLPTWALLVAWMAVLTPLVALGLSTSDPYYTEHWGSTIRILTEFPAGAITYLIVCRLLPGDRLSDPAPPKVERMATALTVALPVLVVIGAVALGQWPAAQPHQGELNGGGEAFPPYYHLLLVPLLVAWIGSLALTPRGVSRMLATRALVLGGFISYSFYMTHLVWYGLWRAGMKALHVSEGPLYAAATVGLIAGALGVAWLMWRLVEEPARERMRALAGARRVPTEEAGAAPTTADVGQEASTPISLQGDSRQ
jgi:peptidoglycan/LPS O-acetylase OafA/YrhL